MINLSNIFNFKKFWGMAQKISVMEGIIQHLEDVIQSQNTLINNVSHEIRSPMHGIYNISEFLNDHWHDLDEKQRKIQVQSIADISHKLKDFINNLLDISKFKAGKMTFDLAEIDLLSLIKEITEYCQKLYLFNNNQLKIIFDNNALTTAKVWADPFRIRQLIQNLLDNAVKYTSKGAIYIKITAIAYNNHPAWQIDIIDEGIGVPQQDLAVIFNSFIRSSNKHGMGTGLGLSICKEIVEAHNGLIWAENNDNKNIINKSKFIKGTTISFILPISSNQ